MFIAPSAYTLGGVQAWLDYVVEGLQGFGREVVVGLVNGRFHDATSYLSVHPFSDVEKIDNPSGTAEGRIRSIARSVQKISPDIVLSVNIADVYPAIARLRESSPEIRLVMTLHAIQADFMQDASRYRESLDAIICTNQLVRLMLGATGLEARRIRYAPYGASTSPRAGEQRHGRGTPMRIGFVGRFDCAQKRVLDVPAILQCLEKQGFSYAARLAGDGPSQEELRLSLSDPISRGKVSVLGPLSSRQVATRIYEWADVLLLTSSWETGPLVIWEAMSCGVPVVSSAYIGSRAEGSLIDRHNCLMFPVGDHAAAANAIVELQDGRLRAKIVQGGRELHARMYSKQASVKAWHHALEAVMNLPPLPPACAVPIRPAGRLDRMLGVGLAESIRRIAGRSYEHRSAGSEWPHSHSNAPTDEAFLRRAARLEAEHDGY